MTFIDDNGIVQYDRDGKRRRSWIKPSQRVCEMCGAADGKIVADHCHLHGWVRGWLCEPCNISIPQYEYALYCPGCTFSPDRWHRCFPVRIAVEIDRQPALGVHLSRCPDCALVLENVMQRQRDIVWRSFRNRQPLPVYARDMLGKKPRCIWFGQMTKGDFVKWNGGLILPTLAK